MLRLPACLPSVITCHSALPKPAGQPEKFPPIAINHGELEKTVGSTAGQHVTFHVLSSSLLPPFSTRRYKLMYAFVVVAVRSFPLRFAVVSYFYPFSFLSFPLLFFFSSSFPREGSFRDWFQRRDISSLLPLNAIPCDRVQASESHLINRYAREARRCTIVEPRDEATTSSRRRK